MQTLPILKPGDTVEIIAPASRTSDQQLTNLQTVLKDWQLNCIVPENIFGKDLLCANTDEVRFDLLKKALHNPVSKAIICARGGYGCTRLMSELAQLSPPSSAKLLVGMSDVTALQLYLHQQWHWPSLHAGAAPDKFTAESMQAIKAFLFAEQTQVELTGKALNKAAKLAISLDAPITGGNLTLVQASIGTHWQMDGRNKIILLEEVGERAYRVDRMLQHLLQANLFRDAAAIVFGDFLNGNEPNGTSLIEPVLTRFAESCKIPVVQIAGIGHGPVNTPIPLGTRVKLNCGEKVSLVCYR